MDDDYYFDDEEPAVASVKTTYTTKASTPTPTQDSDLNGSITDESDKNECSNPGEHKCVDSGKSSQWKTCNFGQWLLRDCAAGLVCFDGNDGKE